MISPVVDAVLTVVVVGAAVAFIASRFIKKKGQKPKPQDAVVGAALQRGLERAQKKRPTSPPT